MGMYRLSDTFIDSGSASSEGVLGTLFLSGSATLILFENSAQDPYPFQDYPRKALSLALPMGSVLGRIPLGRTLL